MSAQMTSPPHSRRRAPDAPPELEDRALVPRAEDRACDELERRLLRAAEEADEIALREISILYPLRSVLPGSDLGARALIALARSPAPRGTSRRAEFAHALANAGAKLKKLHSQVFDAAADSGDYDLFMALVKLFVRDPRLDCDRNLLRAVRRDDPELVRRVIVGDGTEQTPTGAGVNAHGGMELLEALQRGCAPVVRVLRQFGAEPDDKGREFVALRAGEELVRAMIDPWGPFHGIGGALLLASNRRSREWAVPLLAPLTNSRDCVVNALTSAAQWRFCTAVRALTHRARCLRVRDLREILSEHLLSAALFGHVDVAQVLLDEGADPNYAGGQALWNAYRFSHVPMILLLIRRGANPDLLRERGREMLPAGCYAQSEPSACATAASPETNATLPHICSTQICSGP